MKWDDVLYGWLIIYVGCLLYMGVGLLVILAIVGRL